MVIIKDFEMPKKCIWDCPLCREDGGACQISSVTTSDIERPKECPLMEVPDYGKPLEAERMEEQCSKQNRFLPEGAYISVDRRGKVHVRGIDEKWLDKPFKGADK